MINIAIISFNFALSVLIVALIFWFEQEEHKIETINKEYQKNIINLQKIAQINSWLSNNIIPMLKLNKDNSNGIDENLVSFFDENKDKYNLVVDKYIYKDEIAKNMDLSFKIDTGDKNQLINFLNIEYKYGFLQFREFKLNDKGFSGKFQVVESFEGDNNASK